MSRTVLRFVPDVHTFTNVILHVPNNDLCNVSYSYSLSIYSSDNHVTEFTRPTREHLHIGSLINISAREWVRTNGTTFQYTEVNTSRTSTVTRTPVSKDTPVSGDQFVGTEKCEIPLHKEPGRAYTLLIETHKYLAWKAPFHVFSMVCAHTREDVGVPPVLCALYDKYFGADTATHPIQAYYPPARLSSLPSFPLPPILLYDDLSILLDNVSDIKMIHEFLAEKGQTTTSCKDYIINELGLTENTMYTEKSLLAFYNRPLTSMDELRKLGGGELLSRANARSAQVHVFRTHWIHILL